MGLAVRIVETSGIVGFLRQPPNVAPSNEELGFGASFGKESSRLECALASADDGDPAVLEYAEITVVDSVRDEFRRKAGELWRAPGEGNDPGSDDHSLRKKGLAVVELDAEPMWVRGEI